MRTERRSRVRRLLFHPHGIGKRILEYHLLLARDLELIKPEDHDELSQRAVELKRMLAGLLHTLKS